MDDFPIYINSWLISCFIFRGTWRSGRFPGPPGNVSGLARHPSRLSPQYASPAWSLPVVGSEPGAVAGPRCHFSRLASCHGGESGKNGKIWKKWDIMKLWNLLKTTGNPTFLDYHEISKVTKEIHSAHVMVKTRMTKNQRCHVRLSAANTVAKCCKYIILYILLWSARDTNQGNYKRKKKCPAYINTMKQLLLFPSHVFTPCMRLLYSFMTEFEVASMWLSTKKWFNKKINIRDLISKTLITTKTSDTQN